MKSLRNVKILTYVAGETFDVQFLVSDRHEFLVDYVIADRADVSVVFVKVSLAAWLVIESVDLLAENKVTLLTLETLFMPLCIEGIDGQVFNWKAAGCALWQEGGFVAASAVGVTFLFNVLNCWCIGIGLCVFKWSLALEASKVIRVPCLIHGL